MRIDVAHDIKSCLGCGRPCSEPYAFCGRCLSDSYFAARPKLSPKLGRLVFWLLVFAIGFLSFWITTKILHS